MNKSGITITVCYVRAHHRTAYSSQFAVAKEGRKYQRREASSLCIQILAIQLNIFCGVEMLCSATHRRTKMLPYRFRQSRPSSPLTRAVTLVSCHLRRPCQSPSVVCFMVFQDKYLFCISLKKLVYIGINDSRWK